MKTVTIKNWRVVAGPSTPYTAPECIGRHLQGEVYDHPSFTDGEKVTSSQLRSMEQGVAVTYNTTYKLGHPSEDYAFWCIRNGYNVWKGSIS